MPRSAHIVGEVHYREGDGPRLAIPPGPVSVEVTEHDATFSWEDGDSRGSAAMPLSEFKRYTSEGAIEIREGSAMQ